MNISTSMHCTCIWHVIRKNVLYLHIAPVSQQFYTPLENITALLDKIILTTSNQRLHYSVFWKNKYNTFATLILVSGAQKCPTRVYRKIKLVPLQFFELQTVHGFENCSMFAIISVGAQSTLGGHDIFARKMCMKKRKINKLPEFYMILAQKIVKIPEFLWYVPEKLTKFPNFTWFLPENGRILHKNCRKIFFQNFRGHVPPCPPSPTPVCHHGSCRSQYNKYISVLQATCTCKKLL